MGEKSRPHFTTGAAFCKNCGERFDPMVGEKFCKPSCAVEWASKEGLFNGRKR